MRYSFLFFPSVFVPFYTFHLDIPLLSSIPKKLLVEWLPSVKLCCTSGHLLLSLFFGIGFLNQIWVYVGLLLVDS